MKRFVIASSIVAASLALSAQTPAQTQDPQKAGQDTKFIQNAAQGNLTQMELGKLAAQKSQNDQVKQFAEHLQTDHQSANQKLQPIAQSQGVQIPQSLDSRHQRE